MTVYTTGWTLEEALALGRGVERPFRCHEHDDTSASASVNVAKGLWYCYACHAKGAVDSKRVPTVAELEAMLTPEQACRIYPSSFMAIYGTGGYWLDRFPDWVCWLMGFGEDPWTGEGVYPVHTPGGHLAGVGRRLELLEHKGARYKYPRSWSASRSLFGSRGQWRHHDVVTLVEGAADAAALWEVGIPAWAVYGSGLHLPQVELIEAMSPKLIVTGFDRDEAGARAASITTEMLEHVAPIEHVLWSTANDPAEAKPADRVSDVFDTIGESELLSEDKARDLVAIFQTAHQETA